MERCLPAQAGNIGKAIVFIIPFFQHSNILKYVKMIKVKIINS